MYLKSSQRLNTDCRMTYDMSNERKDKIIYDKFINPWRINWQRFPHAYNTPTQL